jgi:hypothetical protein
MIKILEFTDKDKEALAHNLQLGKKILLKAGKNPDKLQVNHLDSVFSLWGEKNDLQDFSSQQIAEGLGSVFGDIICRQFSFSWMIIEDDHGKEPALVENSSGSVVYPVNSIWKRIEPELNTQPFFKEMFNTIEAHILTQKGTNN